MSYRIGSAILSFISCWPPEPAPSGRRAHPANPNEVAATIVAATLQAGGINTAAAATDTPNAAVATTTPAVTATSKAELKINASGAACRGGPSTNDEILTTFGAGTTVDMIAQDTADGYWMVKDPVSGSSCWVKMQDAAASGSYALLPEVTPQATEFENDSGKARIFGEFQLLGIQLRSRYRLAAVAR